MKGASGPMAGHPAMVAADTIRSSKRTDMRTSGLKTDGGRQRGFTLVELMVTLALMAILVGIAVPSFSTMIANNRIATQTNELVGALNLARSEAVRRGQGVSIRSTAAGIEFATGWRIFNDPGLTGAAPATADVLRESTSLAGRTTLRRVTKTGTTSYADATSSLTDRMYVVFNSRGGNNAGASAYFRVCDARDTTIPGRILQVSTVGRISLDSSTATCP